MCIYTVWRTEPYESIDQNSGVSFSEKPAPRFVVNNKDSFWKLLFNQPKEVFEDFIPIFDKVYELMGFDKSHYFNSQSNDPLSDYDEEDKEILKEAFLEAALGIF
jgi:hypothetical protein